jgi:hypothetical protein
MLSFKNNLPDNQIVTHDKNICHFEDGNFVMLAVNFVMLAVNFVMLNNVLFVIWLFLHQVFSCLYQEPPMPKSNYP